MTKREEVEWVELGMEVYHDNIYKGKERMKIVGIRENEVELEGDYSGGTHLVCGKSWLPKKGIFRLRKVCEQHEKFNTCTLPNVHCNYPDCEPYIYPTMPKQKTPIALAIKRLNDLKKNHEFGDRFLNGINTAISTIEKLKKKEREILLGPPEHDGTYSNIVIEYFDQNYTQE